MRVSRVFRPRDVARPLVGQRGAGVAMERRGASMLLVGVALTRAAAWAMVCAQVPAPTSTEMRAGGSLGR